MKAVDILKFLSLLLPALAHATDAKNVQAKPSAPTASPALEISLERRNHLGLRRMDILETREGVYFFNGKRLGNKLPKGIRDTWSLIEKGPERTEKALPCSAGTYSFMRKSRQSRPEKYEGCTEGDNYGHLIENIEKLRQYSKGV
jgi:hypothetical protein